MTNRCQQCSLRFIHIELKCYIPTPPIIVFLFKSAVDGCHCATTTLCGILPASYSKDFSASSASGVPIWSNANATWCLTRSDSSSSALMSAGTASAAASPILDSA